MSSIQKNASKIHSSVGNCSIYSLKIITAPAHIMITSNDMMNKMHLVFNGFCDFAPVSGTVVREILHVLQYLEASSPIIIQH